VTLWSRVYRERRAVILPLFAVLVVNIGVLALVVIPLGRRAASTQDEATAARVALASAKFLERQAEQAATRRSTGDAELQRFEHDILPKDFPTATRTTNLWLQHAARDAGLEFRSSRFETKELRDSRLTRAYSTVTLVGRYPDIRKFLAAMETAEEFVVLERIELAQTDSTQQGPNDRLEIALAVSTFFPTPPQ
jgi:Tfp pilus assembly protein PilO